MAISSEVWAQAVLDDRVFFESIVHPMVGWLDAFAAKRTIDLLNYQVYRPALVP